jgi:outer membrane protein assembly factor BamA
MYRKLFLLTLLTYSAMPAGGRELLSSDSLVVREILIEGNNVTNKKVIYRELDFVINETVLRDRVERKRQISINNLTKTSLFNFVEINAKETPGNNLIIEVKLTERWYIWPYVYLNQTDTNFSEWWRTKDLDKLEYGIGIKINNFRGQGENVLLNYHIGNFTRYELDYKGIYIDKAKRHSLSVLASYAAQNIVPWNIELNRQVLLKKTDKLLNSTDLSIKYSYRRGYFNTHSIEFGYSDFKTADTIYSLNPYYSGLNEHGQRYFYLRYEFTRDIRDSRIYPKTGYLFVAGINKKGLGIVPDEYNSIDLNLRFYSYWKLRNRFYLASGVWYSSNFTNNYVFFLQTGLGYLQFVRGYEYYVVNGSNALLFKNLVKYELLTQKVINLNIWPIRRLYQFNRIPLEIYANVFCDAGYVSDKFKMYRVYGNNLVNKLMYSTGVGIDFITYYDKVLRFDYSLNAMGESGLFIHWKAAIR